MLEVRVLSGVPNTAIHHRKAGEIPVVQVAIGERGKGLYHSELPERPIGAAWKADGS